MTTTARSDAKPPSVQYSNGVDTITEQPPHDSGVNKIGRI